MIDLYEAGSAKPKAITETAVMEEGKWKIKWEDPDTGGEEEISTKIPIGPGPAPQPGIKVLPGKP